MNKPDTCPFFKKICLLHMVSEHSDRFSLSMLHRFCERAFDYFPCHFVDTLCSRLFARKRQAAEPFCRTRRNFGVGMGSVGETRGSSDGIGDPTANDEVKANSAEEAAA